MRKCRGPRSHLSDDISTLPKRANRARNDLANRLKAPSRNSPPKISRRTIALLILHRISKSTRRTCRPAEVREYGSELHRTVQTPMISKTRYQRTNPNCPGKSSRELRTSKRHRPNKLNPSLPPPRRRNATPHVEEGHVRTNVSLITANPSERDYEVPTRSSVDERELNPDEL